MTSKTIRLSVDDGESIEFWVKHFQEEDAVLCYKHCSYPAPPGSGISPATFFLMIQTEWQRGMAEEIGNWMLQIDGTNNVTEYLNLNLYTILGKDKWGHGKPLILRVFFN